MPTKTNKPKRDWSSSILDIAKEIHIATSDPSLELATCEEIQSKVDWLEHEIEVAWRDSVSTKNEAFDICVRKLCRLAVEEGKQYIYEQSKITNP